MTERAQTALRVADLRRACSLLLDRAEKQFGADVDLGNVDHYWAVDLAAAFALTARPEEFLGCGQTSDDLAEMAAMLIRPGDDIVLWHDMDHLAGLLRCVAYLAHSASQTGQGQPGDDR